MLRSRFLYNKLVNDTKTILRLTDKDLSSMELTNISVIKDVMQRHNMNFSKSLGQNFIVNSSICPKIAELGGVNESVGVLEIGPGIGVLTKELSLRAKKVVSIEIDQRLLPVLEETLAECTNVTVISGDVLKIDLHQLLEEEFPNMNVVVCANLPYYITSPIIMDLLESRLRIQSITVMVQKEAAQRICAPIPSRQMGAITVGVSYYAKPEVLFSVGAGSFMPAPKVDSSVIRLDLSGEPRLVVQDEKTFFRVVKSAFGQRRKTLLNSLSAGLPLNKTSLLQCFSTVNIPSTQRAEQLSLEEFGKLSDEIYSALKSDGICL